MAVTACGDPRGGQSLPATGGLSGQPTGAAQGDDEDAGDGDGESTGDKLDVGPGGGTGLDTDGCDKVDFLFVIDSSNSMATNQAQLIASFPAFVNSIQSTLDQLNSVHLGVVTSDAYAFNEPGCSKLGALVTQTGGKDSGMEMCTPFATEGRYMTEADDLPTRFACAALVGTDGDNNETMMEGATLAVSGAMGIPGGCNEGFIREDALLVLILITDEDDPGSCMAGERCGGSPGDPESWLADVVAVKQHPENIVALSLTRGAPNNTCQTAQGAEADATRIMEFVNLLPGTGLAGDICADSFGPFFAEAVALVSEACGGFIGPAG